MKLPTCKDDEEQTIELSTSQYDKKTLPSFVTFDSTSLTYKIMPIIPGQVGTHPIQVNLSDSAGATKSYLFNINVFINESETSSMINRSSLNNKGGKNNSNINASMAI